MFPVAVSHCVVSGRLSGLAMSEQPKQSHLDKGAGTTPPLTHLRRKAGRPRKAELGYLRGPAQTQSRVNGVSASEPSGSRLLNLRAAANYLGVSPWTVRDLEAKRVLKRVSVPLSDGAELRKLLFDKVDLDRLIEAWKA